MSTRTLTTNCFGIVVTINENGVGEIVSDLYDHDLHDGKRPDPARENRLDHAFDAIESIVLAHALAGIDILTPAYLEGIETAVEAATNNA